MTSSHPSNPDRDPSLPPHDPVDAEATRYQTDPPTVEGDAGDAVASATRYSTPPLPPAGGSNGKTGLSTPSTDQEFTRYDEQTTDLKTTGFTPATESPVSHSLPRPFGDYELLEEIARGGMGVVYKARQTIGAGTRIVALKMMLAHGHHGEEDVQRFLLEARAAANLDHPHIVPIYDVGVVDGQHYFTMQLVTGGSLQQQLAAGPLPPREAARLVRQVAEAVQHAHDQGLIHRDIKPHNILLHGPRAGNENTRTGDSASAASAQEVLPKLSDFGLVRVRDSGLSVTGQVMGTPSYMPPEQARGRLDLIGPRSDVYSLGAVLYALLTGRPPFQSADLMQTMQQVCTEEPLPPRQLNPGVPRDMDTVCLKCLEKDPGRRYGSARELAEELARYEAGKPVLARPVGRLERGWRLCKRNPVVASLLVLILLLLLLGTCGGWLLAVRADREAKEALIQKAEADKARKQAERESMAARAARDNLMAILNAEGKDMLGRHAEAEDGFRKALDLQSEALGEEHPHTAQAHYNLAMNLHAQGRYAEAERDFEKALAVRRKVLGDLHPFTATSYAGLASNLNAQGKYAFAQPLFQKALAIRRKVLGEEHPDTASSYNGLALNQDSQSKFLEAQEGHRKALAICRKVLGDEHPDTAQAYHNLAVNLRAMGRYKEAERLLRKSLLIRREVLDQEHPDMASSYEALGSTLEAQGQFAEAEKFFRRSLSNSLKVLGEDHPHTARSYYKIAANLHAQGRYKDAEAYGRSSVDSFTKARQRIATSGLDRAIKTGEDSPLPFLAALLARNGKPEEAWLCFENSLARGTWEDLSIRLRLAPAEQRKLHEVQTYSPAAGQIFEREQIQSALPPDTAMLGWIDIPGVPRARDPNGEHWAILLRSSGEPLWIRLKGSGDNNAWVEADTQLPQKLRAVLQSPAGKWQPLAERLRNQRLQPLMPYLAARDKLPAVRRLLILPSAAMAGVPVEVVADGYTVSHVLSGTFYAYVRKLPKPETNGLLALGDPVFDQPSVADNPLLPLPPGGVLITAILPGSNAARARLSYNDVILRYGDKDISSLADLQTALASTAPDHPVPVVVWRNGNKLGSPLFVMPGKLGVVFAREPAPKAMAERQRLDRLLQSRSGDDAKWARLPGTRAEAASLQRLFGSDSTRLLLDSDASEQQLNQLAAQGELGKYRYIHLATHGEVDNSAPLRSAVILSRDRLPDAKQITELLRTGQPIPDGRLTAAEVLHWQLHCELVTLSACQTALGDYLNGEGFVGFAQALILAGARSVCLTLWKVDDAATALLMERFYQNLLGKRAGLNAPMSKAEALAEAKAWLCGLSRAEAKKCLASLTKGVVRGKAAVHPLPPTAQAARGGGADDRPYAHPFYWAAFVLLGDPE